MQNKLAHRGPDGSGVYFDHDLALAHNRLAVIDVEGGAQPMGTTDGHYQISYNGEIYNFEALRVELQSFGYRFLTSSDTEVLLNAYVHWGTQCVNKLDGMFAFAIWDTKLRKLLLVRDHIGIKPLLYMPTPDGVVFASEIKALRSVSRQANSLNLQAVDEYMTCGYVVNPRSMNFGVRKLPPGHYLEITNSGEMRLREFWSLQFKPVYGVSQSEWLERIREGFAKAVKTHLRSDVPVGVLLSGGVDSTLLASVANETLPDESKLDTFCIGIEGLENEYAWAHKVAKDLGTRHHEVRMSIEDFGASMQRALKILDEPVAEPMMSQLLTVCEYAREHVKVLLSGEGSDEFWFGYPIYKKMLTLHKIHSLFPESFWRFSSTSLEAIASNARLPPKLSKYLRLVVKPQEQQYLGVNFFDTAIKQSMYSAQFKDFLKGDDRAKVMGHLHDGKGGEEILAQLAAIDCSAWLVDNTLFRSDLMSMGASIELRVPFLDRAFVELALTIPSKFKVKHGDQKYILKKAFQSSLDPAISGRKKIGFPTPVAQLLRTKWGKEVKSIIANPPGATRDLFNRTRLLDMFVEHERYERDWSRELFQVFVLHCWATGLSNE